jgi:hypothetical protein
MKKATCYLNRKQFGFRRKKSCSRTNPYLIVKRILAVFPSLTTLMT